MIITLHTNEDLLSKFIQWQTRSAYNHASLKFKSGCHAESTPESGVGFLSAHEFNYKYQDTKTTEFEVKLTPRQEKKVKDFIIKHQGKAYDYTMAFRFVTRRQVNRKASNKWFCSELVFAALQSAGVNLLERTEPWEVSPGTLSWSSLLSPVVRAKG